MTAPNAGLVTKILCPTDFSEGSRAALDYALFMARRFGATVSLLHVYEIPHHVRPDLTVWMRAADGERSESFAEFTERHAKEGMATFLEQLPDEARQLIGSRLEAGVAETTINEIAARESVDLIVMGTHGRTGVRRLVLGSVAEKVVRHAVCPVLTVRSGS